jgi:hypothetical protein
MRPFGYSQAAGEIETSSLKTFRLGHKRLRVEDNSITNHALRIGVKNSGWDLMKDKLLFVEYDRMPGIRTALISYDDVCIVGQNINDLALTFIAPLSTHHHQTPAMRTKHWQSP